MPRRRKLLLVLAPLFLLGAGIGVWYGLNRDSLEAAAMQIQLGMTKAQVHGLLDPFGAVRSVETDFRNMAPKLGIGFRQRRSIHTTHAGGAEFEIWYSPSVQNWLSYDDNGHVVDLALYSTPTALETFCDWLKKNVGS